MVKCFLFKGAEESDNDEKHKDKMKNDPHSLLDVDLSK